jgi:hypothetical protein
MPKEPNTDEPDLIYDLVREDGRLERVCPHGIGHTVGHLDRKQLKDRYVWIHGCDGCCSVYKRMESDNGHFRVRMP